MRDAGRDRQRSCPPSRPGRPGLLLFRPLRERFDRGATKELSPDASFATDPVCGMDVDPSTSTITAEHNGGTVHFCGPGCRDAFVSDPDSYVVEGSRR